MPPPRPRDRAQPLFSRRPSRRPPLPGDSFRVLSCQRRVGYFNLSDVPSLPSGLDDIFGPGAYHQAPYPQ